MLSRALRLSTESSGSVVTSALMNPTDHAREGDEPLRSRSVHTAHSESKEGSGSSSVAGGRGPPPPHKGPVSGGPPKGWMRYPALSRPPTGQQPPLTTPAPRTHRNGPRSS